MGTAAPVAIAATSAAPPEPQTRFDWPAGGEITSIFDAEHPLGIDLGVWTGSPIHASAEGTVVFAGGRACCLYGLYVDVDHGDGYLTRYAHLSEIKVEESQVVAQGDLIGLAGNTGYSFGPHLHFEIVHEGVVQNPLQFLPPR
jgi:murein DD-endopeptidase MepM/ murein hydrolase activator NlpD